MSQFETVNFQVRKYLQSMTPGEIRNLSARVCKYTTLKSTTCQIKKLGQGSWKVKKSGAETIITRIS